MEPNIVHVLAMDISGQFAEGKGTTGWCIARRDLSNPDKIDITIIKNGVLDANNFRTAEDYYNAHNDMILEARIFYKNLVVVVEDFLLYASKAKALINSRMETSQLLGVIKQYCYNQNIPFSVQTASAVKVRWNNAILEHKGIKLPETEHARDAIRHAMHKLTWIEKEGK